MDVQRVFILAEPSIGIMAAMFLSIVAVSVAMMMGPRRRFRHACAGPPPLPRRMRRGGHGWWWVLGIIALVLFVRFKHSDRHIPWAGHRAAESATVDPSSSNFVDINGRPVAMLDVRISLKKCDDLDVEPNDVAAGLLTVIDRLQDNLAVDGQRPRGHNIDELGKCLVRSGEPTVELSKVARLSRRQPLGARDAPLGTIRVRYDSRNISSRDAREFFSELDEELELVMESRVAGGERMFYVRRELDSLVIHVPTSDSTQLARAKKSVHPEIHVDPSPIVEPIPMIEPAPNVKVDESDRLAQLIDATLSWVLGAEERAEIKRAAVETRRDAVREAAKAIAEASTARAEAREDATQALDESQQAIAKKIEQGIFGNREEPVGDEPAKPRAFMGTPDWVTSPPQTRFDERGVYTSTGATDPLFSSHQESREALNDVLDSMIAEYAAFVVTPQVARQLDLTYLRSRATTWTGSTVSAMTGLKVYESHAMLQLGPSDHERLLRLAHDQQSQRSALLAGVAGGTVLLLLGTVLGYLKLDTATRGYYSGRLKFAAGTAAVSVVALSSVVAWVLAT